MNVLLLSITLFLAAARAQEAVPPPSASLPGLTEKLSALQQKLDPKADAKNLFMVVEAGPKKVIVLKQNQLERDYLMSVTLEQGTGEQGLFSSIADDEFVFSFHWAADKLQMLRKDLAHRADPGTPEAKAIERSFPPSVIATLALASTDTSKGLFVFVADSLFLQDLTDMLSKLRRAYPSPDLHPSPQESTVESVQSFPTNLEARVQLLFARSVTGPSNLPDSRRIAIRLHYSVSELPGAGFEPLAADPRVGFFESSYKDYTNRGMSDRVSPAVRLANRWRLEKKEPDAPLSEPKRPITYWIEDTVPEQYRPAIKAGILAWNEAFEGAGFLNAIVVKEVDKDMSPEERARFDPGNAAYNMVRWFMGNNAGFAIGPSRVNPITGEIYNASVSVSDSMARFLAGQAQLIPPGKKPAGAGDELYMDDSVAQARAGLAALEAQGLSAEEVQRYKSEYLTHVMAHEIGHTLGLRHNFKGSTACSVCLGQGGQITSSVMDYMPANVPTDGKGPYYQTQVGTYDKWAIEYGYKPQPSDPSARSEALKAHLARSAQDPNLAYATDEDATGTDPAVQRFDLGKDTLAFARERAELARGLWSRLEQDKTSSGEDLRRRFSTGFSAMYQGVDAVLPIVGGIRTSREPSGEVYAPVSAAEQRAALKFLEDAVLGANPVSVSPELVRRMGTDRPAYQPTQPVPVGAYGSMIQESVLDGLLDKNTLWRLEQRRELVSDPKDAFGARDVMDTMRRGVWKDVAAKKPVAAGRRSMQRHHVTLLVNLAKDEGAPGDARALARGGLSSIAGDIDKALKSKKLDEDTRLHLRDVRSAIDKALDDKSSS